MPEAKRRFSNTEFRLNRQEAGLPSVEGYAAVFNQATDLRWFTESIATGAFKETLNRGDDVRALFNHNENYVLGRNKAGTLELKEDEHGLWTKINPPDSEIGRSVVESIKRGDISQMSFGFYIDEEEVDYTDRVKPHVTIKRVTLFDVSPVTFPAYENTEIAMSRDRESSEEVKRRLDRLIEPRARAEMELRARTISLNISRLKIVSN